MLTKIFSWLGFSKKRAVKGKGDRGPLVIPRSKHSISRANISKNALKVLYRLKEAGFQAFLVGGGVRDVLLAEYPKDFDVATNATPEQIQGIFRNCRLIGRRFRLAHVHFGFQIVEVATFRGGVTDDPPNAKELSHSQEGMILRDNIYGTLEQDVWRRDFTINGLYYNIADFSVIDYVGGMADLKAKTLRMIGDASVRYREDPVRMLRAIRFAAKLKFKIHPDSEQPIYELKHLVHQVPSARVFDEYLKLFLSGFSFQSYGLLRHYGLLEELFPATEKCLKEDKNKQQETFILAALQNTDKRIKENKPVATPFLLAVLLWPPVHELMEKEIFFYDACETVLAEQRKMLSIPRRISQVLREIWSLHMRLIKRKRKTAQSLFVHPRFRIAYDFLLLRAESGDKQAKPYARWWKEYEEADEELRFRMVTALGKSEKGRRKGKSKKLSTL